MTCNSFLLLTSPERVQLIGKLVHLVQEDEMAFSVASYLVDKANAEGAFDGVKIMPPGTNEHVG